MMFTTLLTGLFAASTLTFALPTPKNDNETLIIEERDLEERAAMATVYTKCSTPKTIALTFDDGPYSWTKSIVDKLDAAGAKGTFFWNGDNYGCIYDSANVDRVKYTLSHGHQVASHTWSHADMAASSSTKLDSELKKINDALVKIAGVKPAFVRPPYGNYNDLARARAKVAGQSIVNWDFDSGDSLGKSPASSKAAYLKKINAKPSTILALNHETYQKTVTEVLPYVLTQLKGKGYKLVTVAQCLGKSPYVTQKAAGKRDSTWHC